MIEKYELSTLLKKYDINPEKVIDKNENILIYGEYIDIDKTLNYLVNELKINTIYIEKSPSIMYRNVDAIKKNVEFLKLKKVSFSSVESCLHVLSSDPKQLADTYNYVEKNYGINAIEKNTSILRVSKYKIIDIENLKIPNISKNDILSIVSGRNDILEIKRIIHSSEFKEYPWLFTSEVLSHAKLEDIVKIIHSPEFKNYQWLFTSQVLAHAKLDDIVKIVHSAEFKEYPELFTSTVLAQAKIEDIVKIIHSVEFEEYPELFTSQVLALAKIDDIVKIIHSSEFKNYPWLFTSTVLAHAKIEDIKDLLNLPFFKDEKNKCLLTPTILSNAKGMIKKIPILFEIAKEFKIDNYITIKYLIKSPSQNYAIINHLNDNNIPLVLDGKLNSIFGYNPGVLKKRYNIDLKKLMEKYPLPLEYKYKKEGKVK